jgi:hypothetical protein
MASVVDDGGNWKHRFCPVKRKIAIETKINTDRFGLHSLALVGPTA